MNNLTNRKARVFLFYNYYLLKWDYNDLTLYFKHNKDFNSEEEKAIYKIIDSQENVELKIKDHLRKDWSWERINPIEKAILLNGVAEIILFKNKKAIVINESIELAKVYCEPKAKNLIHAMLDKI